MEDKNNVRNIKNRITCRLSPLVGEREAGWIVRIIFEHVLGWQPVDLVTRGDYEPEPFTVERIDRMVERVEHGEPIQYITGTARFYGLDFAVSPAVLIPRPETAELVDIIVKDAAGHRDLRVLDCGTGSGCIACSLARALPFPRVTAIDISPSALEVAHANGKSLGVNVDFIEADILSLSPMDYAPLDIIVSNPPYIARSEAAAMERHVLDHEPHTALFVDHPDPLLFYRAIARFASEALTPGGRLYFEINPLFVNEMKSLLATFDNVTVERDSQGRQRFITAAKSRFHNIC